MKKILGVLILTLMLAVTCAPALADGDPVPCPPNAPNCRPPGDPVAPSR